VGAGLGAAPSSSTDTRAPVAARRRPARPPAVQIQAPRPAERRTGPVDRPATGDATLEARLRDIIDYTVQVTSANSVFVADELGLPVAGTGTRAEQVAATAHLLKGITGYRMLSGENDATRMTVHLGSDRHLHLSEAQTSWGQFVLGFVCHGAVDSHELLRVHSEFLSVFREKGDPNA